MERWSHHDSWVRSPGKEIMKSSTRLNSRKATPVNRFVRRLSMVLAIAACAMLQPADAATVRTVALSGQQAPGTPSGVNLTSTRHSEYSPVLNDVGQTAFQRHLTGSSVDNTNRRHLVGGSGSLSLVARRGGQAPGTPSGVNFYRIPVTSPVLNDAGQTAFYARTQRRGQWHLVGGFRRSGAGSPHGPAGPGTPSGVNFSQLVETVLNDAGQTAFYAASPAAAWIPPTTWHLVGGFRQPGAGGPQGDQAPGTPSGVNYSGFASRSPVLNDAGQTAFNACLTGSGVDYQRSGHLVGRFRQPSAGGPHREPRPWHTQRRELQTASLPVLNNAGKTAFRAGLTGSGVDSTNNSGIWSEGSGSLALVARVGTTPRHAQRREL